MKNRAMARKLERARIQAREAAAIEFGKVCYLTQPSKRELRTMVPAFDGVSGGSPASRRGSALGRTATPRAAARSSHPMFSRQTRG